MGKRIYIWGLLMSLCYICSYGQVEAKSYEVEDSISVEIQPLSISVYDLTAALDRDYNYELLNKKRRLKMWSSDIMVCGYAAFLGVVAAGVCVGVNNGWSEWITVPVVTVAGLGVLYGSAVWSNNLKKKADAITVSSVAISRNEKAGTLYASAFGNEQKRFSGIGLSYKLNF